MVVGVSAHSAQFVLLDTVAGGGVSTFWRRVMTKLTASKARPGDPTTR